MSESVDTPKIMYRDALQRVATADTISIDDLVLDIRSSAERLARWLKRAIVPLAMAAGGAIVWMVDGPLRSGSKLIGVLLAIVTILLGVAASRALVKIYVHRRVAAAARTHRVDATQLWRLVWAGLYDV